MNQSSSQAPNGPTANDERQHDQREQRRTSLILLVLRVGLMAMAAWAVSWPLTTPFGSTCASLGAVAGVLLGTWLGHSRVRQWLIVVGTCVGFVVGLFGAEMTVVWSLPTSLLGGRGAVELAELLRWGVGSLCLMLLLRASSHRYPAVGVFELMLPLMAAASLFSAHREGNIHRPQQLVDFALERGQDPTWYLRLLGVAGALFMAVGLLRLRRGIQIFGGVALIFLLVMGMFLISTNVPRSTFISLQKRFGKDGKERSGPQPAKIGKKGKKAKGQKAKKRKNQKRNNKPLPFQPNQRTKREKQKPVAIVIFKNDYKPPSGIYYFRQKSLSQFNGVRMVQASEGDIEQDQVLHFPVLNTKISVRSSVPLPPGVKPLVASLKAKKKKKQKGTPKDKGIAALLKLLRDEMRNKKGKPKLGLRQVDTVISLMYDHKRPFGLVSPLSYRGLPNPNPSMFLRSYKTSSLAWEGMAYPRISPKMPLHTIPAILERAYGRLFQLKVGEQWWPKSAQTFYTTPPEDPRYRKLLEEKVLKPLRQLAPKLADNKLAQAVMIKHWLQKHAAYSMRIRASGDIRDQVAHFLFKSRIGYCVHFSHAAVYMFRLIGVPARVGEGYAVPARERGSSSALLIRAGAAHAWSEIYLRGFGWVPFDIYPERNLDAQRPRPPDPKYRQMLANLARPKKLPPLKKSKVARQRKSSTQWAWDLLLALWRFPWYLIPLGLLVLAFLLKWGRQLGYLVVGKDRRLLWYYKSLEDRLSEHGLRREAGETLEHFATRCHEWVPSLTLLFQRLEAARMGSSLAPTQTEKALMTQISKEYRSAFAWYWQLLRMLDPYSWSGHIWQRWQVAPPAWWLKWLDVWEQLNQQLNRLLFVFRRAR